MTDNREHAIELLSRLPEGQITGLIGFLETLVDPVAAALRCAPADDEPESEEERRDVAEAREWLRSNGGKGIPHAEAMRHLGLE